MGQTLVDDAQTEEDKILIDSKVGHVTANYVTGNVLVSFLTYPSQSLLISGLLLFLSVEIVLLRNFICFLPFNSKVKLKGREVLYTYCIHILIEAPGVFCLSLFFYPCRKTLNSQNPMFRVRFSRKLGI